MDIPADNKKYRKILLGITVIGLLIFSLYFLLGRIQVSLMSNVLFQDSFWITLLPFLQTLITILSFALFYGISVLVLCHCGMKKTIVAAAIVVLLTLFKYAALLLGSLVIDRIDPYSFVAVKLPTSLLSLLLEVMQYAVILTVAWFALRRQKENTTTVPPYRRPLIRVSLTVMLINIASRIIYDIGYGAPTSSREVLLMVLAYVSDILLYGVLLYFLMRLVTKLIK